MKLIRARTLEITEIFDRDIPPYAILSHTWVEDEEVSYQEMMNHEGTHKSGFQKIKKCCSQALKDELEWVWVDTCSIDKTSSAELSEAINSMFRYYSQAAVCYAYLADVDFEDPVYPPGHKPAELISSFETTSWNSIGDLSEWRHEVSKITSIHYSALTQGAKILTEFSIARRMSWAASRKTSREEDMAYCLLGILGVHIPLLYGEGKNAFIRLQEEIMKNSDDQTIFAWQNPEAIRGTHPLGILAPSPNYFRNSSMNALNFRGKGQPYSMTNAGLQLTGILVHNPSLWDDVHVLCLPVYDEPNPDLVVGLPLKQLSASGDQFTRSSGDLIHFPTLDLQQMKNIRSALIYVRQDITSLPTLNVDIGRKLEFRIVIGESDQVQIQIGDSYPERQVYLRPSGRISVIPPERYGIASHLDGYSWHVALILSVHINWTDCTPTIGTPVTETKNVPALTFFETCQCVLFVGYNGRTDQPWCAFDDISSNAEVEVARSSWRQLPERLNENISKWVFSRKTSEDSPGGKLSSGVEISASLQMLKQQGLRTEVTLRDRTTVALENRSTQCNVNLSTRILTHAEASTSIQD